MQTINLKGERDIWFEFVKKVKINKTTVWKVLKPFLKEYKEVKK